MSSRAYQIFEIANMVASIAFVILGDTPRATYHLAWAIIAELMGKEE